MACAVLLDLDGTLVDSYPGIVASCRAALRDLGHELEGNAEIRGAIGPPLEEVMRGLLQPFGDGRVDEAVAAYRQHYGQSGFLESAPYPGIGESLSQIKQAGFGVYLATSKRTIFANHILANLKLTTYFEGIYGSEPSGELDHKPELLAHIVARHGLSPFHSVMVGDRRHDIAGARSVGMRSIGVLWGYGSRSELEIAGADCLVNSTADLPRAIFSMLDRSYGAR